MNFRFRLDIHWSSVRSSSKPPGELPAQVTRMSMGPSRSSAAATQRSTSGVTLMSPASASTRRPVADWISLAVSSSGSGRPRSNGHLGALGGEMLGDVPANTFAGAGDEGHFSVQLKIHRRPLPPCRGWPGRRARASLNAVAVTLSR